MNRKDLDRELDQWLDRATVEYGTPEIRPGFERRILAKVNSRLAGRKWYFRWLPVAVASAAGLFGSVYMIRSHFESHAPMQIMTEKSHPIMAAQTENPGLSGNTAKPGKPGLANTPIRERSAGRILSRSVVPITAESQRGQFLSSGLSDRERYLIAFMRAESDAGFPNSKEEVLFEPLQIPQAHIPEFKIENFEISSFENSSLHTSIPGSEEEL